MSNFVCTDKCTVTQSNQFQFTQYKVGTELFCLVGYAPTADGSYEYQQIILDKTTLKQGLSTGELNIQNLKLSCDGKLLNDNSYDKLIQHIQNRILTGTYFVDYLLLREDKESYDFADKQTCEYFKQNPNFDEEDLDELLNAVIQSLNGQGKNVYNFIYAESQDENRYRYTSCNLKSLIQILSHIIDNDILDIKESLVTNDLEASVYSTKMSENYRMLKVDTKNIREVIDFILENNRCNVYDTQGYKFYLNDNLKNALQKFLEEQWTLDDAAHKLDGCIKVIKSQPGFSCTNQETSKWISDIITRCRQGEEIELFIGVNEHGRGPRPSYTKEQYLKDKYMTYQLISKMIKKDRGQITLAGLQEFIIKSLGIKIRINYGVIQFSRINASSYIDSLLA